MIKKLFENEDLIAVDKPEGLASIPEGTKGKETLLSLLQEQFTEKLYVVHRLGKLASGVIVFAKNADAHRYLNGQFSDRAVTRTYLAVTHGVLKRASGTINKPLREFGSGRMGFDHRQGKPSITKFQVMNRFGDCTLVKAHPLTGTRHQIRVHLYNIGHPIAGDTLYGDKEAQGGFPRLMLHAQEIMFRLPSGEEVRIISPIPASFRSVLADLKSPAY
ncbi:MAG: RluA family pseudouridine synthase [Dehalococcoidia bacterium]